ncbi:uncharacterized protein LOC117342151 isoform X2 [Pecten maximus]|uniref:uncharacterized protein LOC117342151 isoform X2 n=1 Tax=Pecten maximus TaxID=6579 RepID=UPI00145800A8|nr:uncharacterized protein LOC117342151 isoform X2 [Pecten maximus]
MCRKETWFLLVLFHLNVEGNAQLIGEEKKYVFLEQAVLERVRPAVLEMMDNLETRIGRLEEENRRILSELKSIKGEAMNGCPIQSNCAVSGLECPRFYMDPTTLYSAALSRDKLTLSNRQLENTYDWPTGTDPTRVYQGVTGSRPITNSQKMYFETDIFYQIEEKLTATNLVFEVAFATENAIGESYYVGKQKEAWSVNAHNNGSTQGVTLFFKSNGGSIKYSERLSDATSGTEKNLTLGFFLNIIDKSITVFDIKKSKTIYTFTEVDRLAGLWPVFGVYQARKTYVRIRLNTQRDIISAPCGLF